VGVVVRVGRRGEVTADTRQQAVLAVKDTAVKLSIQSFQTATQVKSSNNQISTPLLSTATHNNHACYFHKKNICRENMQDKRWDSWYKCFQRSPWFPNIFSQKLIAVIY